MSQEHGNDCCCDGVAMIAVERERQKAKYNAQHDDSHDDGELWKFAVSLAADDGAVFDRSDQNLWPVGWDYPERAANSRIVELAIAGAMIAAEIDRLKRLRTPMLRCEQPDTGTQDDQITARVVDAIREHLKGGESTEDFIARAIREAKR